MLAALFLLYITAVSLRITERELAWITTMAVAGGVLASVMAISGFYSGVTFSATARSTLAGDGRQSDPNIYAAGLLLPVSLAIGKVLSARSTLLKALMAISAGIIMLSVLLTMSRGALLAVFVMIAAYVLRYRLSWKIITSVAILLAGLAFVPDVFFSRLQDAAETGGAGRLDIWIAGLYALKHYALFGAGLANFPNVYTLFSGYAPNFTGYARDAHNIYLAIAVELGIGGLALMLLAIGTQLRDARPHKDSPSSTRLIAVPAEAAFWAILVSAAFLNLMYRKSLWLVLIMVAISVRARQQREDELRWHDAPGNEEMIDSPFALDGNRPITTAALAGTYRLR
jgi:O-antigen ligase